MSAASHPVIDPVELTRDLIRRPSVTPADEGAMDMLEAARIPVARVVETEKAVSMLAELVAGRN